MKVESNEPYSFDEDQWAARPPVSRCASCEIEIHWPPTTVNGQVYCCPGCAAGGPCTCDYSQYRSVHISGVIHYMPKPEQS